MRIQKVYRDNLEDRLLEVFWDQNKIFLEDRIEDNFWLKLWGINFGIGILLSLTKSIRGIKT